MEADIDFSDEGDVSAVSDPRIMARLTEVASRIDTMVMASRRAERVRAGLKVVLAGEVNAGKSRLFNRLAQRDAAIVSECPGTTRDRLEVHLDIGGWPVTIIDTAGLRDTEETVERLGIERSREAIGSADLVLHLSKEDDWPDLDTPCSEVLAVRTQIDFASGSNTST